jgi:molybdopterin-guanine dinucleotide biosynthesis protein A
MGVDKAAIRLSDADGRSGPTLAERTVDLLLEACSPAVEVGPGRTCLPAVAESPAGAGPLAAMVAGWDALRAGGWFGPVVVVATDLPMLTSSMLVWLAEHPASGSVVPVAGGRVQPLCARYSPADMDVAARLVRQGERALSALLDVTDPLLAGEDAWAAGAGGDAVLTDVDTPEDLRRVTGR